MMRANARKNVKTIRRTCAPILDATNKWPFLLHAANICASNDVRVSVGDGSIAATRHGTSHAQRTGGEAIERLPTRIDPLKIADVLLAAAGWERARWDRPSHRTTA
jgi:hypothetical protein